MDEDRKWATAMRKTTHIWDEAWWRNTSDPPSWPVDTTSSAVRQSGSRGGLYWKPSDDQLNWERAASEEAALSQSPPPAPKKRNAPANISRPDAPKARSHRPQSLTPEGSLPIVTPPPSPEPERVAVGDLASMGPMTLGRTSPIHLCVTNAWRIYPLSCAGLSRGTRVGWYLFETRFTNINMPTIVWHMPAIIYG